MNSKQKIVKERKQPLIAGLLSYSVMLHSILCVADDSNNLHGKCFKKWISNKILLLQMQTR